MPLYELVARGLAEHLHELGESLGGPAGSGTEGG
jgi:hypothetical protein